LPVVGIECLGVNECRGVFADELQIIVTRPGLSANRNDAGVFRQFVMHMRHVQRGQQFAK
jgi:hypothetical protein